MERWFIVQIIVTLGITYIILNVILKRNEKLEHIQACGTFLRMFFTLAITVGGIQGYVLSNTIYKTECQKERDAKIEAVERKMAVEKENKEQAKDIERLQNAIKEGKTVVLNLPSKLTGTIYRGSVLSWNDDIRLVSFDSKKLDISVGGVTTPLSYEEGRSIGTISGKNGKLNFMVRKYDSPPADRNSIDFEATYTPFDEIMNNP